MHAPCVVLILGYFWLCALETTDGSQEPCVAQGIASMSASSKEIVQ